MSDNKSFPSTKAEALSLEWLRKQDLNLPADELLAKYDEYHDHLKRLISKRNSKDFKKANKL